MTLGKRRKLKAQGKLQRVRSHPPHHYWLRWTTIFGDTEVLAHIYRTRIDQRPFTPATGWITDGPFAKYSDLMKMAQLVTLETGLPVPADLRISFETKDQTFPWNPDECAWMTAHGAR